MSRAAVFITAITLLFLSTGSCFPMPGDQKPSPAGTSLRAVPAGAYPLDGYGPRHNTGAGKRASQPGQAQVALQAEVKGKFAAQDLEASAQAVGEARHLRELTVQGATFQWPVSADGSHADSKGSSNLVQEGYGFKKEFWPYKYGGGLGAGKRASQSGQAQVALQAEVKGEFSAQDLEASASSGRG